MRLGKHRPCCCVISSHKASCAHFYIVCWPCRLGLDFPHIHISWWWHRPGSALMCLAGCWGISGAQVTDTWQLLFPLHCGSPGGCGFTLCLCISHLNIDTWNHLINAFTPTVLSGACWFAGKAMPPIRRSKYWKSNTGGLPCTLCSSLLHTAGRKISPKIIYDGAIHSVKFGKHTVK